MMNERELVRSYLKKSRLFSILTEPELNTLVPLSQMTEFEDGRTLLYEGRECNQIYLLMGGKLGVYLEGQPIIELRRKGDIIGEMSVISNKPCAATVKAIGAVQVFSIRTEDIKSFQESHTSELEHLMYRLFAMIMTDKLTMTTDKAKRYEQERRQIKNARSDLKQARLLLDIHAKQLAEAKEKAEAANQAKSDFLANVSHELRNPMHQVLSYSRNGIKKIDRPKEKLQFYFSQIKKSADRLMVFLNDLLDLSKMESGKMIYTMAPCDLWQVVVSVVEDFQTSARDKHIKLSALEPTISCKLTCDEFRIEQVVRNLLSNALKYTPGEKGVEISIEKCSMPKGRRSSDKARIPALKLKIKDEGVGIPENELIAVFDKFVQSSKTSTGAGGTGLGLAICKEIMDAHHGKIWAESNKDGGVTFIALFPLQPSVVLST